MTAPGSPRTLVHSRLNLEHGGFADAALGLRAQQRSAKMPDVTSGMRYSIPGGLMPAALGRACDSALRITHFAANEHRATRSGWRKPAVANERDWNCDTDNHGGMTPAALGRMCVCAS
jgi:hypothetical protein